MLPGFLQQRTQPSNGRMGTPCSTEARPALGCWKGVEQEKGREDSTTAWTPIDAGEERAGTKVSNLFSLLGDGWEEQSSRTSDLT